MQGLATLIRRGVNQQQVTACSRAAAAPWHWDALRQSLASIAGADAAIGEQRGAAPAAAAAPARAAAATAASPPPRQQLWKAEVPAEARAEALAVQQQMQDALAQRDYNEVLRLLHESEGFADRPGSSNSAGSSSSSSGSRKASNAAAASAPAAAWHPYDRAALYDCALRACAARGDPDEARRLVSRMWKQQVPVGIVAATALIKALCDVGRRAEALEHLGGVPTKRQRTTMYTALLRSCNDAGELRVARDCWAQFQRRQQQPQGRHLQPDAWLLAEVIKMHGAAGDVAAAEAAWMQGGGGGTGAAAPATPASAPARSAAAQEGPAGVAQACLHAAWVAALARAGQLQAAVAELEVLLDRFSEVLPVEVVVPLVPQDVADILTIGSSSSGGSSSGGGSSGGGSATAAPPSSSTKQQQREWAAQGGAVGAAAAAVGRPAARASIVKFLQEARNAVLAEAQARGDDACANHVAALATMRGLPPDVGTYNSLLRAALAHDDGVQAVLDGVGEMRALGIRPDWQTYLLVLKACSGERDPEAAQAALDGMAADGVAPGRLHHNALLNAYASAGDLEGIDAAYRRMQAAGFSPDSRTFKVLLESVRQWASLETAGRAVDVEKHQAVRQERVHQRQSTAALLSRWAAELDASRPTALTPDIFTSLLHAYSQCGQVYHVLLLMRDAFGVRLPPSTTAMLGRAGGADGAAATAAAAAEAAEQHSREIEALEAALASSGSSSSSSSSREGGTSSAAAATAGSAQAAPVPPPPPYARPGPGVLRSPLSARTLEHARLQPSLRIYNAAIAACTRVGHEHLADAVALLRSMLPTGLSPDVHTYTSLIAGCAYGRQAALARELLRQMRQRGIEPTSWTYNALLNVECWTYGVDAGVALLRTLAGQGMQPDRATWNTLLASARLFKRADVIAMAQDELQSEQQREEAAAEAAAAAAREAVAAAAAAGKTPDDHGWHGYYERQQEDEDEW